MPKLPISKWKRFFQKDLWIADEEKYPPILRSFIKIIRIIILSTEQFNNNRIVVRASALTYSTLLSIIPIFAILFAIARGFGFDSIIEGLFRNNMSSHQAELVITWINSYLQHAKSGIFIGIGIVMLLWTILILTDNIERSFNTIWQVKRPRSVFRKITDYFSMILLLPLLIVFSSGLSIFMTTFLKEMETFALLAPIMKFFIQLLPYAIIWAMFIGLFVFIPNTKVKLSHAIIPGILAGSAFQIFQYIYINSQIWVSNYNAIYGSFAAIPMFLLWTQISWSICLFGAEMNYVSQNLESFKYGKESKNISRRYHDFFCTIILSKICKRFENGEDPYSAEEISKENKIPIRLTKDILYELQDLQLIYEGVKEKDKSEEVCYLPGISINKLTLGVMLNKLDSKGFEDFNIDRNQYSSSWDAMIKAREEYTSHNNQILLKDI